MELYKRKDHQYFKWLIPSKLPQDFKFCFGSNSTGDHGPVTAELASTLRLRWELPLVGRGKTMEL